MTREPSPRECPVVQDGVRRDPERFRGFLYGAASEKAHLNDAALARIRLLQPLQRLVQAQDLFGLPGGQGRFRKWPLPFQASPGTRIVHQHLAHHS